MKKSIFLFMLFCLAGYFTFAQSKNKISTKKVETSTIVPYASDTCVSINGVQINRSGVIMPEKTYNYIAYMPTNNTISLTKNTWANLTNATNNFWTTNKYYGITNTKDTLTIANAGVYTGYINLAFTGHDSDLVVLRVWNITDSISGYSSGDIAQGTVKYGQIFLPFYLDVTANTKLVFQVVNKTSSNAIVTKYSKLIINYLHK